jgi:hypothetical protein
MAQRYDYWTHGIATILESPGQAQLVQHRSDIGTAVEQGANTSGWFHLPIPTPSVLADDSTTNFLFFALVATVNENAKLDLIHVRRGKDLIFSKNVSFVSTTINQVFDTPDVSTSAGATSGAGITLSVHVQFLTGTPRGRVEFHGAGAAFS